MYRNIKFSVSDPSIAGEIRRSFQQLALELGFDETLAGKVSIVVNELTTNILKHAGNGTIIGIKTRQSLEILALDKGKGMSDPSRCMEDGFSTQGTPGTGLGAIRRLSSDFQFHTEPSKGTAIHVSFSTSSSDEAKTDIGAINIPYKNELVSGDGWVLNEDGQKLSLLMSDGLGHGLLANEATETAIRSFNELPHHSAVEDIQALHHALRSTRGAALGVALVDLGKSKVDYAGLGNIAATNFSIRQTRRMISYNGIAGVQLRKVQPMTYPLEKDSMLILASDGLSTHWNLMDYPGLQNKSTFLVAGVLYRDFGKTSDDVSVVVVRIP